MDRVTDLPHTADIGFELEASSLSRLFELAAEGLLRALDPGPGAAESASGRPERLTLARPDLERLLVAWLRELLHRATADRLYPASVRATVHVPGTRDGPPAASSEVSLEAHVHWRKWTEETAPAREIKGVTYHGLEVAERDGAWHARVLLDV